MNGKPLEVISPDYLVDLFSSDVFTNLTKEALQMVEKRQWSGFQGFRVINKVTIFTKPVGASYRHSGQALERSMSEGNVGGAVPENHAEPNAEDKGCLVVQANFDSKSEDGYPRLELTQNLINLNRDMFDVDVRPICIAGSRYRGEGRLAFYQQIPDKTTPSFIQDSKDVLHLGAIWAYTSGELARVLGSDTAEKFMGRTLGGDRNDGYFSRPDVKKKIDEYLKGQFVYHISDGLRKTGFYKAEVMRFGENGIYKGDIDKVRQFSTDIRETRAS